LTEVIDGSLLASKLHPGIAFDRCGYPDRSVWPTCRCPDRSAGVSVERPADDTVSAGRGGQRYTGGDRRDQRYVGGNPGAHVSVECPALGNRPADSGGRRVTGGNGRTVHVWTERQGGDVGVSTD
jgi:hypothetical protein